MIASGHEGFVAIFQSVSSPQVWLVLRTICNCSVVCSLVKSITREGVGDSRMRWLDKTVIDRIVEAL
jgi:hypothetical protein